MHWALVAWSNIGFDMLYAKPAALQHLRPVCEPDKWGFESPEVLAGDWAKMLPSLRKSVRFGVNTRPSITTGTPWTVNSSSSVQSASLLGRCSL